MLKFLSRKTLVVIAPPAVWKYLAMYLVVINGRLLKRGWPLLNLSRLVGAILSEFVVSHAREIDEEFNQVRLDAIKGWLPRFFSPEQLDAIAAASSSEIPDVLRIGWRDRERKTAREKRWTIRESDGEPSDPFSGPTD